MSACTYYTTGMFDFKKKDVFLKPHKSATPRVQRVLNHHRRTTMSARPFSPSNTNNDDLFVIRAADTTDGTFHIERVVQRSAPRFALLSFLFTFFFVVKMEFERASFSASRRPVMNTNEIPIKLPERCTRGDDRYARNS